MALRSCVFGGLLIVATVFWSYLPLERLGEPRDWVYDDSVAIMANPVLQGHEPLQEVWRRDFWGRLEVSSGKSMKSFRPLTTLTFRLEWSWRGNDPKGFHRTNLLLHAVVSLLAALAAYLLHRLSWVSTGQAQGQGQGQGQERVTRQERAFVTLATGLLFAAHPVHTEAVSNVTGRNEVLMALWFLLGLDLYLATHQSLSSRDSQPQATGTSGGSWGLDLWTVLLLFADVCRCGLVLLLGLASMLSKEPGVMLPLLVASLEIAVLAPNTPQPLTSCREEEHKTPLRTGTGKGMAGPLLTASKNGEGKTTKKWDREDSRVKWLRRALGGAAEPDALAMWLRVSILFIGAVATSIWRKGLNQGEAPSFFYNANRAVHLESRFYRALSIAWLWVEHAKILLWPQPLSVDWGADCIPTITSLAIRWGNGTKGFLDSVRGLALLILGSALAFILAGALLATLVSATRSQDKAIQAGGGYKLLDQVRYANHSIALSRPLRYVLSLALLCLPCLPCLPSPPV